MMDRLSRLVVVKGHGCPISTHKPLSGESPQPLRTLVVGTLTDSGKCLWITGAVWLWVLPQLSSIEGFAREVSRSASRNHHPRPVATSTLLLYLEACPCSEAGLAATTSTTPWRTNKPLRRMRPLRSRPNQGASTLKIPCQKRAQRNKNRKS